MTTKPSENPKQGEVESITKEEKVLSPEEVEILITTLRARFLMNEKLHPQTRWADVEKSDLH